MGSLLKWDLDAERELWADVGLKSFWWFCDGCVRMSHFPKAHRWWHEYMQRPLCEWYQSHVEQWLVKRDAPGEPEQTCLMVLLPREFAKTSVITQMGQLWLHLRDPDVASATGAETTSLAQKITQTIKTIISGGDEYSWFTWLYGNWFDPNRKWRDEFFTHAARRAMARQDYSVNTWGVATGLLGAHPDALFFDDPISYDAIAKDALWLEKVNAHVANLGPVTRADCLIVWIGTRYGDGDHFGTQIKDFGLRSLTGMPHPDAGTKDTGRWHMYYMSARDRTDTTKYPKGRPTFPEQWPDPRLRNEEITDPQKYAAQLLNDPSSSEFNPLTMAQVDDCWVDEKDIPYNILRYSMHFDVAFKDPNRQARGDESVIEVWGHQVGTGIVWYIEGYSSRIWRGEDFYRQAGDLLQKYHLKKRKIKVITCDLEPGGYKGTINHNLMNECAERNLPITFRYEPLSRAGKVKGKRMIEPCGYWVNGFVRLRRNAPGVDRLIEQMTKLPSILAGNGHDDWADAAADVFHPKVYIPLRRDVVDIDAPTRTPYDDELKPGRLEGIAAYDAAHSVEEERSTYEPI